MRHAHCVVLFTVLYTLLFAVLMPFFPYPDSRTDLDNKASEVFTMINDERTKNGLQPLQWREDMSTAATIRTMESMTLWSHTRPDGSPWWTADDELLYGENLGKEFKTPKGVMKAWMKSKSHADNILNKDYTGVYVKVMESSDGILYWTQEFTY